MNKSVRRYLIMDLLVLTVLGCLLEGITSKFIGFALDATPTITISLLIVFIAVCRWNLWGLIPIPFLAFATILGGHFSDIEYFRAFYSLGNWQLYLSIVIGLSSVGINVVFFRNHRTNKIVKTIWQLLLILILDYLLYCALQFMFYRIFTTGGLTQQAMIEYPFYEKLEDGTLVYKPKNLAQYGENGIAYNLYGLAVAVIGALVVRSQGVLNNAVDKLLSDKKEREAELEYLKSFGNEKWDKPFKHLNSNDESQKEEQQDSSEQ